MGGASHPVDMATETGAPAAGAGARDLLSGAVGGLAGAVVTGVVIQVAFDPSIISGGVPAAVGASGLAVGWVVLLLIGVVVGLVYAGLATLEPLSGRAAMPNTGAALGLVYGLVLWALAVVAVPFLVGGGGGIGAYAVSSRAVLAYALLGLVVGLVYGVSPYTGR